MSQAVIPAMLCGAARWNKSPALDQHITVLVGDTVYDVTWTSSTVLADQFVGSLLSQNTTANRTVLVTTDTENILSIVEQMLKDDSLLRDDCGPFIKGFTVFIPVQFISWLFIRNCHSVHLKHNTSQLLTHLFILVCISICSSVELHPVHTDLIVTISPWERHPGPRLNTKCCVPDVCSRHSAINCLQNQKSTLI